MSAARSRSASGRALACLRAVVALVAPSTLTGCGVFGLAGGLGLCNSEPPDITISIASPTDGAVVDGEPVRIEFELSENPDGVFVEEWLLGLERVYVAPGEVRGTLEGIPLSGFNDPVTGEPQPLPTGTYTAQVVVSSRHDREDLVTIDWVAPWRLAGVEVCSPHLSSCGELTAQAALAGRFAATPRMLQDAERLVRAELRVDGAVVDEAAAAPFTLEADLDALPDGAAVVTIVAERDDGRRATLDHPLDVANCARLVVTSERYVVYGDDATRYQGTLELSATELRTGVTTTWPRPGPFGEIHRVLDDGDQTVYAGYSEGGTGVYAFDRGSTAAPTRVAELPVSAGVGGIALADDGALYVTSGLVHDAAASKHLYRIAGGVVTEVTTSPLPASDVLVDEDGTLLVPADADLWRLTVVDGVEVARDLVLTRPGRALTRVGLDELGRIYVVAVDPDPFAGTGGEVLRYATPVDPPEVLHADASWRIRVGGSAGSSPQSIAFQRYPAYCHGLVLNGMSGNPGPASVVVDVGDVRGRP